MERGPGFGVREGGGDAAKENSPVPQGGSQERQQGVQGVEQQESLLFDAHCWAPRHVAGMRPAH